MNEEAENDVKRVSVALKTFRKRACNLRLTRAGLSRNPFEYCMQIDVSHRNMHIKPMRGGGAPPDRAADRSAFARWRAAAPASAYCLLTPC